MSRLGRLYGIISIHAPLRERPRAIGHIVLFLVFQSTLPYGSDKQKHYLFLPITKFQSTLPYGSDASMLLFVPLPKISIHAPLRERPRQELLQILLCHFNPRSLTGATTFGIKPGIRVLISIHAPLRERPINQ